MMMITMIIRKLISISDNLFYKNIIINSCYYPYLKRVDVLNTDFHFYKVYFTLSNFTNTLSHLTVNNNKFQSTFINHKVRKEYARFTKFQYVKLLIAKQMSPLSLLLLYEVLEVMFLLFSSHVLLLLLIRDNF